MNDPSIRGARRSRLALLAAVALLGACAASPPKPVKTHITVTAAATSNPDPGGRPSPVVVRLYQLRSETAFASAEFFALFDDDKKVLSADLAGSDEFELAPGETRGLDLTVPGDVRFLGAIAAYRDLRNSTWRALLPLPKGGLGKTAVKVTADRQAVRIELGH
ncbi:MAG: type VI secretion system lipoprotein TssJ [Proteobacteria bacterium]|nr:type VI secretion system lipoprotein TssJ [Pseudomonadota bacterium]